MFSNIKRSLKRAAIFILALGVIFVIVLTIVNLSGNKLFSNEETRILIDADTGNGIDELFAISRALTAPELEVIGLTSVHWEFSENAGDTSLEISQNLNRKLLKLLNRSSIPHPKGARKALRFEKDIQPRKTAAANFIIQKAHETDKKKKLNIVSLGALTNVASAIMMDPDIIPKVRIYMMGLKYDPKTKIWNKNEFNTRNDLDAVDFLLNTSGLEMHIMTATSSEILGFNKEEAEQYLVNKGEPWDFLMDKWNEHCSDREDCIMWDVSIIEALIDPSLTRTEETLTPPENNQRIVKVYTFINKELIIANFYSEILKYQKNSDQ